jgi:hypothetical protein
MGLSPRRVPLYQAPKPPSPLLVGLCGVQSDCLLPAAFSWMQSPESLRSSHALQQETLLECSRQQKHSVSEELCVFLPPHFSVTLYH